MRFGAHLPLMDFGGDSFELERLVSYTETAIELGFDALSVNDHMVFSVPWLDGPMALATVLAHSGDAMLATTVANPVVRGPVPLAKAAAAIDRLSGGRLVIAVGPGSSAHDYQAVGVSFEERWRRLDEVIPVLRSLLQPGGEQIRGRFYSTAGLDLQPYTADPRRCTRRPRAAHHAQSTGEAQRDLHAAAGRSDRSAPRARPRSRRAGHDHPGSRGVLLSGLRLGDTLMEGSPFYSAPGDGQWARQANESWLSVSGASIRGTGSQDRVGRMPASRRGSPRAMPASRPSSAG